MPAGVTAPPLIQPSEPGDLAQIMDWEERSFRSGWSALAWAEEIRDHYVAVAWGSEPSAIGFSDESAMARGRDGGPLGVIALSMVADTADLRRILVAPDHRRNGVGEALVRHGFAWAIRQGVAEMFLEVAVTNDEAVRLYQRCGFEQISFRSDYYGPGEDAAVYRWRPCSDGSSSEHGGRSDV